MIEDNPYCKFCKRKFCSRKQIKDSVCDRDLETESRAIKSLSRIWGIELKQTTFIYCPLDFYCPEIPLMGDITSPKYNHIYPITERWATPGWVIEWFKLSTLIDAASCAGLLSFYVWSFNDKIKVLSAIDIVNKYKDTMYDDLTTSNGLHLKPENPQMPRSKGKYINPHRMEDPLYYFNDIRTLIDHHKHNKQVDSIDDFKEDY